MFDPGLQSGPIVPLVDGGLRRSRQNDIHPLRDLDEILTALGTVSAVIVALVLAGAPAIKRWWSKPVLEATTGLEEPFVRPVSDEHTPIAEVRLRVGITNTGRSTARSVRAQLLDWWEHDSRRAWHRLG